MLSVTHFKSINKDLIQSKKRIVLAFSGGLDSSVLLHLLAMCSNHDNLLIWHINHHLQKSAALMEQFCSQQTALKQLAFNVSHIDLSGLTSNIEAQAREARYHIFAKELNFKKDLLLTAHHADDQLETILLNMCRGTGVSGLRGIGRNVVIKNIATMRPLLTYSRAELEAYAHKNKIEWIDDPTNALNCFDRNYIRHELTPVLKRRWPSLNESFMQVAKHQKEAAECLHELALIDYKMCFCKHDFSNHENLKINTIRALSIARQKNLIRYWVSKHAKALTMNQSNRLIEMMAHYANEFKYMQINNGFIALFDNALFCVLDKEIKTESAITKWLASQPENYICRLNKKNKGISSHFLKRQFQAKKIPPWLRDQTMFLLGSDSKHIVHVHVL